MKISFWSAILVTAFVLLSSPFSAAQSCQMYTYADMWFDNNGNAVVENYTDADQSCSAYLGRP